MVSPNSQPVCPICAGATRRFYRLKRHNSTAYRCKGCGYVWLEPPLRAGDADYEAHYEAPSYEARMAVDVEKYSLHLRNIEKVVPLAKAPGKRVLEIGSQFGVLLGLLRERGFDAEGIELLRAGVESSRAAGFTVHHVPLEKFSSESPFDLIISTHVLEHLRDVRMYFERTAALLRPGGLSIILTPSSDAALFRLLRQYWAGATPDEHNLFIGKRSTEILSKDYGFEVLAIKTTGRFWPLWRGILAESWKGLRRTAPPTPAPSSKTPSAQKQGVPQSRSGRERLYGIVNTLEYPFLFVLHSLLAPMGLSDELLVVLRKKSA